MPITIPVGIACLATLHEWSGTGGTGVELKPIGPVTYTSDNPVVATVNSTTGLVTGVSAGTANITGTDAGNSLTASDVVTVATVSAQSATLTLDPLVINPLKK